MYKEKCVVAIIVAAGKGTRVGGDIPKQFLMLNDRSILERTIDVFEKNTHVDTIVVVTSPGEVDLVKKTIIYGKNIVSKVVKGDSERTGSVYNGIRAISEEYYDSIVLIHDGVRPFVSQKLINSCIEGAYTDGACIPVTNLVDTIKRVTKDKSVKNTLDRDRYKAVQTPQGFLYDIIRECYENAKKDGIQATDDAAIVEHYGYKVKAIEGLEKNIKITTPFDLKIAETIADIL